MADKQAATAVALIPDPAKTVEPVKDKDDKVDVVSTRAAEKAARVAAWKRESTKAARKAARDKRVTAWEEATGRKWEER